MENVINKEIFSNHLDNFKLFPIGKGYRLNDFKSSISDEDNEYDIFLKDYAIDYEEKDISKTHLLINIKNGDIVSYITLLTGSIKLKQTEIESHSIPNFASYPSLKIAKLAVDNDYKKKYKGIGSTMIELAIGFKEELNNIGVACRFLEVDADVENDRDVYKFYEKLGFVKNSKYKEGRTISMRLEDTK